MRVGSRGEAATQLHLGKVYPPRFERRLVRIREFVAN